MPAILTTSAVTAALLSWNIVPSSVTQLESMDTCKNYITNRFNEYKQTGHYEKHMISTNGTKLALYNEKLFVLPGSVQGMVYECEESK